jgi:uncharacterized protein YbjT (DUF2867 family)
MNRKILVPGATGKVGSELVRLLVKNSEAVCAASRNPPAAELKFHGNIKAVEFDYELPETFAPALKGVDKVFLVVRPGDNEPDKLLP